MDSLIHAVVADDDFFEDESSYESSDEEKEERTKQQSAPSEKKRRKRQVTACARHRAMRKICPAGCPDRRAPKPSAPNARYKKLYKPTVSSTRSLPATNPDSLYPTSSRAGHHDIKNDRDYYEKSSSRSKPSKQPPPKRAKPSRPAVAAKASSSSSSGGGGSGGGYSSSSKGAAASLPISTGVEPIREAFPWPALIIEAMLFLGDGKTDKEIIDYIREHHLFVCKKIKNSINEVSKCLAANAGQVWMAEPHPTDLKGSRLWRLRRSLTDGLPGEGRPDPRAALSPALWQVLPEQRWTYAATFKKMDVANRGSISGSDVRDVWMTSKLPVDDLAAIWDLVDPAGCKTTLDPMEFAAGMHLITLRLNGHPLPATLPRDLVASLHVPDAMVVEAAAVQPPPTAAAVPSLPTASVAAAPSVEKRPGAAAASTSIAASPTSVPVPAATATNPVALAATAPS